MYNLMFSEVKFNVLDGKVNRKSHEGDYKIDPVSMRPLCVAFAIFCISLLDNLMISSLFFSLRFLLKPSHTSATAMDARA